MTTQSPATSLPSGVPGGSPPARPVGFLEALRRNRFVRDENGQGMVELVIVGPFLVFVMMSVIYFFEYIDAQQDYYIKQAEGYWSVVINASQQTPTTPPGRTMANSDEGNFGSLQALSGVAGNIRLMTALYGPAMTLINGNVDRVLNYGVAVLNTTKGSPGIFSFPPGNPYLGMGLPVNNYDTTNPPVLQYRNPWRNVLLGMASFFNNAMGGSTNDAGFLADPLNIPIRFRMITGDWMARRPQTFRGAQGDRHILDRSKEMSIFQNAWGTVAVAMFGIAAGAAPPVRNFYDTTQQDGFPFIMIDFDLWFSYKIDPRSRNCTNNPLQNINGQQAIDMWL